MSVPPPAVAPAPHHAAPASRHGAPSSQVAQSSSRHDSVVKEEIRFSDDEGSALGQLLTRVEQFRARKELPSALRYARAFLELYPNVIDARRILSETLLALGRSEEAIEELLEIASLQLEEMDAEGATVSLETVLQQDPGNERATQILEELRGAMERRSSLEINVAQKFGDAQEEPAQLEELGPAEFETTVDATDAYDDASADPISLVQPASRPPPGRKVSPVDQTVVGAPIPLADPAASASIEDALEEAEFFASRGMVSDAIAIIEEQLRAFPRHPLLNEKIEELRALEGGDSSKVTA